MDNRIPCLYSTQLLSDGCDPLLALPIKVRPRLAGLEPYDIVC